MLNFDSLIPVRRRSADKFVRIQRAANLSQDQLSERIGIDPKHLSRIELGKSFSSLETLEGIATVLQVELKDLFDFSHLEANEMDKKQIEELLDGLNQDKLRLVYKVVKSLVK
ncbi:MAG: helix-turn-helix transcriptional regulator [Oryzomonas sp.]|uniref:helix-turn-helix domain-containing protein n=1 Tax=Oryzomonas sp. TaxID=2855186 RepID=UPI00284FC4AE|nr:helix-turn-helix transcriptional regulator [Oryzomonas sp.]MDR3578946.1 helix-turn-helix transcriptional regulator [Oryzomonas sp.]